MIIALASKPFINNDISYNSNQILETIRKVGKNTDMLVFGEAFLQGFDSLTWNYLKDHEIAVSLEHERIELIRKCAAQYNVAVSFGYLERADNCIFSSQITINKNGNILNNFRRVSPGWKKPGADRHYREGHNFELFQFQEKKIVVGLCGDLWYEENVECINRLEPDLVFWPVYCDYDGDEWNNRIKYEYAAQARKIANKVFLVNSICNDAEKKSYPLSQGGAVYYLNGKINEEIVAGKEGVLFAKI